MNFIPESFFGDSHSLNFAAFHTVYHEQFTSEFIEESNGKHGIQWTRLLNETTIKLNLSLTSISLSHQALISL